MTTTLGHVDITRAGRKYSPMLRTLLVARIHADLCRTASALCQ
ncbi:putative leader peptide [Sciscionella marina]